MFDLTAVLERVMIEKCEDFACAVLIFGMICFLMWI